MAKLLIAIVIIFMTLVIGNKVGFDAATQKCRAALTDEQDKGRE